MSYKGRRRRRMMAAIKAFKTGGAAPRRKGDRFEHKVKKHLEKCGYWVRRAPRSAFPDLVAITKLCDSSVVGFFIEVRMNKYISKIERQTLSDLNKNYGLQALIAYKDSKVIKFCDTDYNDTEI